MKPGLVAILVLGLMLNACQNPNEDSARSVYRFNQSEMVELKEGDVLFRKGNGLVSNMIGAMQKTDFNISHCGILVKNQGRFEVISAVSSRISEHSGVHGVPLDTFVANSVHESVVVLRLEKKYQDVPKQMAEKANFYKGQEIPFDHAFDLKDTGKMYCTELIYRLLTEDLGLDNLLKASETNTGKPYIGFKAFFDNPHFRVVLNHQVS